MKPADFLHIFCTEKQKLQHSGIDLLISKVFFRMDLNVEMCITVELFFPWTSHLIWKYSMSHNLS